MGLHSKTPVSECVWKVKPFGVDTSRQATIYEATERQHIYRRLRLTLVCFFTVVHHEAVHTGRNTHTQIMEHTAVNGSDHTGCKQHQRVCMQICVQICLRILCEWGPSCQKLLFFLHGGWGVDPPPPQHGRMRALEPKKIDAGSTRGKKTNTSERTANLDRLSRQ